MEEMPPVGGTGSPRIRERRCTGEVPFAKRYIFETRLLSPRCCHGRSKASR